MLAEFSPSDDLFRIADRVVRIKLTTSGNEPLAIDVRGFKRQMFYGDVAGSQGTYTQNDVHWNLCAADLSVIPAIGQRIVESDDATWSIMDVQTKDHDTRWKYAARKL